ncbi:hypothetical protein KY284_036151 [Solanum tuberosum]|nr:hypothetical protein KY284_036151 [Solanum tuberosum]
MNNQPRVVDENLAVDGIIPPHRQPITPRGRAQHPAKMMYEEDDLELDGARATGAIVLPALHPGMFRGATGEDANQHLINLWRFANRKRFLDGSFMRKPFSESMQLMDEVSKNNRAWYTMDAEVGDPWYTYELSAEQRKREEERDQDMAYMWTQIDLLTKHIVSKSEKVNALGQPNRYEDQDIDLDEEANFLGNQGGFQNYNSGNQGYNSGNAGRNYSREGQYDRPANREQGN